MRYLQATTGSSLCRRSSRREARSLVRNGLAIERTSAHMTANPRARGREALDPDRRLFTDGKRGKDLADQRRELEPVAAARRADHDRPEAVQDELAVG